jgi:hypothetical protein
MIFIYFALIQMQGSHFKNMFYYDGNIILKLNMNYQQIVEIESNKVPKPRLGALLIKTKCKIHDN